MSSTSSTSPWILQQQQPTTSRRIGGTVEPLNLWSSSSSPATWTMNYNSALASLTSNDMSNNLKYPSRNSPLTPTSPTCSPVFSPASFNSNPFTSQQHPPDSPHSVIDGFLDFSPAAMLEFCPSSSNNVNKRPHAFDPQVSVNKKRSKSFTIDAILGLEEYDHQRRISSSSESPEPQSPPSSSCILAATTTSPTASSTVSSSPRAKRVRTIFSAEQLERLEAEFIRQQYVIYSKR